MSSINRELEDLAIDLTFLQFDMSLPEDEHALVMKALSEVQDSAIASATASFERATRDIVTITGDLFEGIERLGAPPSAKTREVAARLGRLHALVHDDEGMRTTWQTSEEFDEVFKDEDEVTPAPALPGLPPRPQGLSVLTEFVPQNSRKFATLADEYLQFFVSQDYRSDAKRRSVERQARTALRFRPRYAAVEAETGVPWWFVAAVHMLESTFNFTRHLHNGDSLSARTHRVPAGRPATGTPPFDWVESAIDALRGEGLHDKTDWSLARALYRWEAYNGFGYRSRGVPTPYLWSFSTVYGKGKFVGDGVFSKTAVSKQVGAAVLLRALFDMQEVDLRTEQPTEGEADAAVSETADAEAVVAEQKPNIDGQVSTNTDFRSFFAARAPDVTHFEWHEFLVKGGGHGTPGDARFGLNTDPPSDLWENILPLARVLQRLREELGRPVILTSAYRSPEYNDATPGAAKTSQHLFFRAVDFKVPGHANARAWFDLVNRLRSDGVFSGGIGRYNSFVHVDVRGTNATWGV